MSKLSPEQLKKEKSFSDKAKSKVIEYFKFIKEKTEEAGNNNKKPPQAAKKNQIKGLQIAFQQDGIQAALELAGHQLDKKAVTEKEGFCKFWEIVRDFLQGELQNQDYHLAETFIESFCCHYYYEQAKYYDFKNH